MSSVNDKIHVIENYYKAWTQGGSENKINCDIDGVNVSLIFQAGKFENNSNFFLEVILDKINVCPADNRIKNIFNLYFPKAASDNTVYETHDHTYQFHLRYFETKLQMEQAIAEEETHSLQQKKECHLF